jgi:hypothetical protein
MKRFRLGTLMLLIVIAALTFARVVQHDWAARREAKLQARLAQSWPVFLKKQQRDIEIQRLDEEMERRSLDKLRKEATQRPGDDRRLKIGPLSNTS